MDCLLDLTEGALAYGLPQQIVGYSAGFILHVTDYINDVYS